MTVPTQDHPTAVRPAEDVPPDPAPEALDTRQLDPDEITVEYDPDEATVEHDALEVPTIGDVAPDDDPGPDPRPARPMIDPRIRERRIEVMREAGRRRLRITLVIASAIVVCGLAYLAVHSPLLAVGHIRVTGAEREPTGEILRAAGVHNGQALVFVDTGAVERRVEQLHWVARARVRREFPGTLSIAVTEYVPAAYVPMTGGKLALVASSGRVIGLSRKVPVQAVEVLGVRAVPVVGASLPSPAAAGVIDQLPPHLRSRVGAIDVGGASPVIDLRTGAPAPTTCGPVPGSVPGFEQVRLGTFDALREKGVAALSVLNHLGAQRFTYIDVSVPQAPVSC